MRTCTGCRTVAPQRELVRLVLDGSCLIIDPSSPIVRAAVGAATGPAILAADQPHDAAPRQLRPRRLPGRGTYVHPVAACVTTAGLSRSLRRPFRPADVARIVAEMSRTDDNLGAKAPAEASVDARSGGAATACAEAVTEPRLEPGAVPGAARGDQALQTASQNAPGLDDGDTVEMPPRIKAKDDRSEDARL